MSDIADYVDLVEERQEALEEKTLEPWGPMHPPAIGRILTARGIKPEVVADVLYPVRDVQDDSLLWAVPWNEATDMADDGEAVVTWEGMYDE